MTEINKIYTPADFERYHAGTMPVNEMHELEKAALEDPFLADALEGYAYTTSIENDIADLKERLNKKRKKRKVFSISSHIFSCNNKCFMLKLPDLNELFWVLNTVSK